MSVPIRTWKYYDINEIKAHLVIVGQLSGDCANCKAIGIDYLTAKTCPQCKAEFKFIATRQSNTPHHLLKRIQVQRPELEFIDYSDFKLAVDRNKAREFFSK
ncbi:MAG: hypothetical protein AB1629_06485 [Candidatus Omnitrophota bacterium]